MGQLQAVQSVDPGRVDATTLVSPRDAERRLREAWEAFHTEGSPPPGVRSIVVESWRRSALADVNADLSLLEPELDDPLDATTCGRGPLIRAAEVALSGLEQELVGTRHVAALADQEGLLLTVAGDPEVVAKCASQSFAPGFRWDEGSAGTNGVGTALAAGRPVQIFSGEHYCAGWLPWVCSGAPVRHPITRQVIGAVDVTGPSQEINGHSYSLARLAAAEVEDVLERQLGGRERKLLERYRHAPFSSRRAVLTVDWNGSVMLGNRVALQHLSGEDVSSLQGLAGRALREDRSLRVPVEIETGTFLAEVELVRSDGAPIGAVISARPVARRAAETRPRGDDDLGLVGDSPIFLNAVRRARRLWEGREAPLLIAGEAGTGKTALACALGAADPEPVRRVDCFSPGWDELLEDSELEATIVLEHVDELAEAEQRRLGALLERVDEGTRIVLTSTLAPSELQPGLSSRVTAGTVVLPSLRDRNGDVRMLVEAWCDLEERRRPPRMAISPAAMERLLAYEWPGNVSELFGVLTAAKLVRRGQALEAADLNLPAAAARSVGSRLDEIELDAVRGALERTDGNVSAAARLLGVSRSTLHRRMKSYKLRGIEGF